MSANYDNLRNMLCKSDRDVEILHDTFLRLSSSYTEGNIFDMFISTFWSLKGCFRRSDAHKKYMYSDLDGVYKASGEEETVIF